MIYGGGAYGSIAYGGSGGSSFVSATATMPISWLKSIQMTGAMPLNWTLGLIRYSILPVSWEESVSLTDIMNRLGTPTGASISGDIAAISNHLPMNIKKNTAFNAFPFLMVDSSGNPKTGLTVTASRSLDGGAFAACANAVTETGNGFYAINLAATDVNGNSVALNFTAPGAVQRSIAIITNS